MSERKLSAREMRVKRQVEEREDRAYLREINRVDNNNSHDDA